jgi:hypothetical protein
MAGRGFTAAAHPQLHERVRAMFAFHSGEMAELETYLASRAAGMPMDAPACDPSRLPSASRRSATVATNRHRNGLTVGDNLPSHRLRRPAPPPTQEFSTMSHANTLLLKSLSAAVLLTLAAPADAASAAKPDTRNRADIPTQRIRPRPADMPGMDAFAAMRLAEKGPAAVLKAYKAFDEIGMLQYKVFAIRNCSATSIPQPGDSGKFQRVTRCSRLQTRRLVHPGAADHPAGDDGAVDRCHPGTGHLQVLDPRQLPPAGARAR